MPNRKGKTGNKGGHQVWKESSKSRDSSSAGFCGFSELKLGSRTFREAWGTEAFKKQAENHMCISMELVTVVLGDHGHRSLEYYVVVTAVTSLAMESRSSTPLREIIAFCRKWRSTTNHVWLFSTRKSVSSFFAAYGALCEEGTTTLVCKALDEVADISVTASKDHVQVQGEILEGLVARMVSHESSKHMEKVLKEFPQPSEGGFFVDINLFKVSKDKAAEYNNVQSKNANGSSETSTSGADGLADEDANLMIKLKFLTYKIRTFLIRNGLSILFKDGPAAYRTYYLRQMKIWGTSSQKQKELSKMLDEWASYIRRKCGNKQLSSSIYLTEAEPFLEQYARRSPHNQMLIGSAGNLVRSDDFLAIVESGRDEEGDLETERNATTSSPHSYCNGFSSKDEGLIVFFLVNNPLEFLIGGLDTTDIRIPGCAKSALCKEILNASGGLGDDRPVHSLMGDLIKGKYWQMVANERRKKPYTITLGLLDKTSPCVGYVLLMFYHLYDGKSELIEHFGTLVKIPLLKPDRSPLPDPVKSILEEGICLFELHRNKHGRLESSKGSYKDWANWEIRLRQVLLANADSLNAIQVQFDYVVKQVLE
ncbi:hypothetical protein MKW92_002198 [Papaver armeniacum]|nr:hypothetical protein MKW92_002198 [Papaver armeniacum]